MTDFAELRLFRRGLRAFCASHAPSIEAFESGSSYRRELTTTPEEVTNELRHLTSTATCLESLGEIADPPPDLAKRWREFAQAALDRQPDRWTSEDSAAIYCRCRALPLVIRGLEQYDARVDGHVASILEQLQTDGRFAIGEADGPPEKWYPANAFHTYWTLQILDLLERRFPKCSFLSQQDEKLRKQRSVMLLWARQVLGSQIALHNGNSTARDTDQLVWALACVLRGSREWAWVLGDQDLIRQALAAVFSTQTAIGNWPSFQPLFHYRESGNAYCYVFETLSALLRVALQPNSGFLQVQLKAYCGNLARLWKYAESTAIPIESMKIGGSLWAWSSGHRSRSTAPESWATASVYSFAQVLRRLIGIWTRETALQDLNLIPLNLSCDEGERQLRERGATWSRRPVSHDLLCLFVNPTRWSEAADTSFESESLDPDRASIRRDHSRSAILYGPPGTSKTTLARSVAAAVGWAYVEIHASHFVAQGLPNVQKRADDIFERLMELDRTVVLFDEIDELVREREEGKAEVFGRFLTTSMLPKVAELWSARKVLYFVATNHVGLFDAAILRSQRFDAILFVPPPSFEIKAKRLIEVMKEMTGREIELLVSREECEKSLEGVKTKNKPEQELPRTGLLAKFILLRWDQLEELAYRLAVVLPLKALQIDSAGLSQALHAIADVRLSKVGPYIGYQEDQSFARRDFGKYKVWAVEGDLDSTPIKHCVKVGDKWWLFGSVERVEEFHISGWSVAEVSPGIALLSRQKKGG